jgi:hypothetical protein
VKQVSGLVTEHDRQSSVQTVKTLIKVPAPSAADPEKHPVLVGFVIDEATGWFLDRTPFQNTEVPKKDYITIVYRFDFNFDLPFRKKPADLTSVKFVWVSLHEWLLGP